MRAAKGFTVIELVIVLVLVGIASVVVISRFIAPSTFNDLGMRDALITTIRAAQQAAIGRSSVTPGLSAVTFAIGANANEWILTANENGNPIRRMTIPTRNLTLETGSSAPSGSTCVNDFDDVIASFRLDFDNQGNLRRFVNGSVDDEVGVDNVNGVRICVNDTVEFSVCVSPSGYAYAGSCEP